MIVLKKIVSFVYEEYRKRKQMVELVKRMNRGIKNIEKTSY